jgi:hypothetical protein
MRVNIFLVTCYDNIYFLVANAKKARGTTPQNLFKNTSISIGKISRFLGESPLFLDTFIGFSCRIFVA